MVHNMICKNIAWSIPAIGVLVSGRERGERERETKSFSSSQVLDYWILLCSPVFSQYHFSLLTVHIDKPFFLVLYPLSHRLFSYFPYIALHHFKYMAKLIKPHPSSHLSLLVVYFHKTNKLSDHGGQNRWWMDLQSNNTRKKKKSTIINRLIHLPR